jgi:murein DD-endopeptidase MepM/ murein hydrolase activator NlpD
MFGNPVRGRIRPPGSPVIVGSFRVIFTLEQHLAAGRAGGTDIGNGKCGAPVIAIADGHVTLADTIERSIIVRIKHPEFPGHESGYAHLASFKKGLKVGDKVNRGDRIGTLGKTGTSECHLHFGLKLDGVEIPSWPLLEQNMEVDVLKGTLVRRIVNRKTKTLADGTRLRPSPGTADPPLAQLAADTEFVPDFLVEGQTANGSKRWYGGWVRTPRGREFGYISVTLLGQLRRIEKLND